MVHDEEIFGNAIEEQNSVGNSKVSTYRPVGKIRRVRQAVESTTLNPSDSMSAIESLMKGFDPAPSQKPKRKGKGKGRGRKNRKNRKKKSTTVAPITVTSSSENETIETTTSKKENEKIVEIVTSVPSTKKSDQPNSKKSNTEGLKTVQNQENQTTKSTIEQTTTPYDYDPRPRSIKFDEVDPLKEDDEVESSTKRNSKTQVADRTDDETIDEVKITDTTKKTNTEQSKGDDTTSVSPEKIELDLSFTTVKSTRVATSSPQLDSGSTNSKIPQKEKSNSARNEKGTSGDISNPSVSNIELDEVDNTDKQSTLQSSTEITTQSADKVSEPVTDLTESKNSKGNVNEKTGKAISDALPTSAPQEIDENEEKKKELGNNQNGNNGRRRQNASTRKPKQRRRQNGKNAKKQNPSNNNRQPKSLQDETNVDDNSSNKQPKDLSSNQGESTKQATTNSQITKTNSNGKADKKVLVDYVLTRMFG